MTRTVNIYRYTHYPLLSLRGQLLRTKHWLFPQSSPTQWKNADAIVAG